jgi:hypothetical protein
VAIRTKQPGDVIRLQYLRGGVKPGDADRRAGLEPSG